MQYFREEIIIFTYFLDELNTILNYKEDLGSAYKNYIQFKSCFSKCMEEHARKE